MVVVYYVAGQYLKQRGGQTDRWMDRYTHSCIPSSSVAHCHQILPLAEDGEGEGGVAVKTQALFPESQPASGLTQELWLSWQRKNVKSQHRTCV